MGPAPRNRAERRRTGHRRRSGHQYVNLPVLPGVVPDLTEASKQEAMHQAHQDLPYLPGTQVCLAFFTIDDGCQALADAGYTSAQLQYLRDHADAVDGDDPHIVVASRQPIEHGAGCG